MKLTALELHNLLEWAEFQGCHSAGVTWPGESDEKRMRAVMRGQAMVEQWKREAADLATCTNCFHPLRDHDPGYTRMECAVCGSYCP